MGLRPKQGDFTGAIGMCQEERQGSVARALAFRASSIEVQHSVVKYPSLWGLVQRQHATLWTWKLGFESLIPSTQSSRWTGCTAQAQTVNGDFIVEFHLTERDSCITFGQVS